MDRGGWWATVHGDTSEQLSMRASHLEDYDFGGTKLIGKTLYLVQGKGSVLLFFHPLSGFLFKPFSLIPKLSDSENSQ